MAAKMEEPILHVKGWVNARIKIRDFEVVLPDAPWNSGSKYFTDRVGFRIGLGAINFSRQNTFAHTCANKNIQIHPHS